MRWSSGSVRRAPDLRASRIGLLSALLCGVMACPAAADIAYVTCQNGDALSVIDTGRGTEIARWPLPGKPAGVAVGLDGSVYTVSPDNKAVRRLSQAGTVLAEARLDGGPIGIALDAARDRVLVSDWYNARIWVLNAHSLKEEARLITGAAPAGLALSDDGRFLASADRDADQVSIFDAETLSLRHRADVGTRPFGLRFAPDGRLFVANVGTNDLSVINPDQGQVIATVPVGQRPYGVAFARGRAFVSNQYADTVSVIDLASLAPVGLIEVGEYPEGIDATADGSRIAVANWFDNTLTLIDSDSLSVVETIETADGPRAFGLFLTGDPQ